jgi:toxin-antitoxin system PIN domain toxin
VLIVAPIALLDVNVLIALLDPQHGHHEPAHRWFQANANHGWATCPLTQNALLRILSNPRYPNSPGGPAVVMPLLQGMLSHPDHLFWPDLLSWSADAVLQAELASEAAAAGETGAPAQRLLSLADYTWLSALTTTRAFDFWVEPHDTS